MLDHGGDLLAQLHDLRCLHVPKELQHEPHRRLRGRGRRRRPHLGPGPASATLLGRPDGCRRRCGRGQSSGAVRELQGRHPGVPCERAFGHQPCQAQPLLGGLGSAQHRRDPLEVRRLCLDAGLEGALQPPAQLHGPHHLHHRREDAALLAAGCTRRTDAIAAPLLLLAALGQRRHWQRLWGALLHGEEADLPGGILHLLRSLPGLCAVLLLRPHHRGELCVTQRTDLGAKASLELAAARGGQSRCR
mmetsp:Transcript_110681/g.308400  ORF Transcript_110681/g.308400 Transcript_110681/m.308400 type:complete len:247 (-) Transcript_110681:689-1429(-)